MPYLKIKKFSFACSFFTFLFLGFLSKLTNPTANADEISLPMCAEEICTNPADAIDGSTICVNDYNDTNLEEAIGECSNVAAGESCNLRQAIHFAAGNRLDLTICLMRPIEGEGHYALNSPLVVDRLSPETDEETETHLTIKGDSTEDNWRPTIRPATEEFLELVPDPLSESKTGYSYLFLLSQTSHVHISQINFSGILNSGEAKTNARCIFNNSILSIEFTDFYKCNRTELDDALFGGGAIYSWNTLTIQKSSFRENGSRNRGGAIDINMADLSLENSYFYNNVGSYGGAINIREGQNSTINGSTFYKNKAAFGGAVAFNFFIVLSYSGEPNNSTLTLNNSNFVDNQSYADSSSLYFDKLSGRDGTNLFMVSDSIFTGGINGEGEPQSDCSGNSDIDAIKSLGNNYWGNLAECKITDSEGNPRAEGETCLADDICADGDGPVKELYYLPDDIENSTLLFHAPADQPFHTYHFYVNDTLVNNDDQEDQENQDSQNNNQDQDLNNGKDSPKSPNNDNPDTTNNSENTDENDNGGCSLAPSKSLKTRTLLLLFFCLFPATLFLRSQPIFKTNES